jgi:PEP-CTERM motif
MKFVKRLLAAAFLSASAVSAMATPVTYTSIFEGTTFRISTIDGSANSLNLQILGALSSTGGWASAVAFDNFALKDIGSGITGGTVSPGTWSTSTLELNASGCSGGASGGVCFDANPAVALADDMNFRIDLSFAAGYGLTIGAQGPHLKVRFVDAQGGKVGSLLSTNLGQSTVVCDLGDACNDTPLRVPEPGSLALAGLALLAGAAVRRRAVAVPV